MTLDREQTRILQRVIGFVDELGRMVTLTEVRIRLQDHDFWSLYRTIEELQRLGLLTTGQIGLEPTAEGRAQAGLPRKWERKRPELPPRIQYALTWVQGEVAQLRAHDRAIPIALEELAEWWTEVSRL